MSNVTLYLVDDVRCLGSFARIVDENRVCLCLGPSIYVFMLCSTGEWANYYFLCGKKMRPKHMNLTLYTIQMLSMYIIHMKRQSSEKIIIIIVGITSYKGAYHRYDLPYPTMSTWLTKLKGLRAISRNIINHIKKPCPSEAVHRSLLTFCYC